MALEGDTVVYMIILGVVIQTLALLWLGGLAILNYLLRYKSVPSIYRLANHRFEEIVAHDTVLTVANGPGNLKPIESRVMFFPDLKGPCQSYIKSFEPNAGRVKCFKKDCDLFHHRDAKRSSLLTILERLRSARQVDLCMYRFSIKEASDVLISLHQSGARVRIITDTVDVSDFTTDQIPRLKSHGIEVREMIFDAALSSRERPLMHNKFVIIDRQVCFAGSFNWTWKALTQNQEMVIECHERTVVQPLVKKFEQLWRAYAATSSLLPHRRAATAVAMASQQQLQNNKKKEHHNQHHNAATVDIL